MAVRALTSLTMQAARYTFRAKSIMPVVSTGQWMEYLGKPWLNQFATLSIRTNTLRARCQDVLSSGAPDMAEVGEIIGQAKQLDPDIARMHKHCPLAWRHDSISLLPGQSHKASRSSAAEAEMLDIHNTPIWPETKLLYIYKGPNLASHHNAVRILRMYAQATILRCLWFLNTQDTDDFDAEQHEQSVRTIQQMTDDICATIPLMLTPDIESHVRSRSGSAAGAEAIRRKCFSVSAQTALLTLQPTYAISTLECIPELQRKWLKGRLLSLSRDWGLVHAVTLSTARPCLIAAKAPFDPPLSGGLTGGAAGGHNAPVDL